MVVNRTTALLFLLVPHMYWLSRTIGQVLISNTECVCVKSSTGFAFIVKIQLTLLLGYQV